jgi:hypothetical protein
MTMIAHCDLANGGVPKYFSDFTFGIYGRLMFIAHAPGEPKSESWRAFVEIATEHANAPGASAGWLVYGERAGLSAAQRKQCSEIMEQHRVSLAVLTRSTFTRRVITAISWLTREKRIKPFDTLDLPGAFAYLGVERSAVARLQPSFLRVVRSVGVGQEYDDERALSA